MFQESTWDIPIVPPLNRSDGGRWLDPLPYLLSMFVFANRVTSILVQHDAASRPQECAKIQGELTEFYNNMPEALRFNATALGAYAMLDHGGGFVLLHVSWPVPDRSAVRLTSRCGFMRWYSRMNADMRLTSD
jgi:hypothetical protein